LSHPLSRTSSKSSPFGLTLQRHFERFPPFKLAEPAFTMGAVGLIVAVFMIVHKDEKVSLFALGFGETALHEQASLRQSQGRRFFLNLI
jgi:hypothetical protein